MVAKGRAEVSIKFTGIPMTRQMPNSRQRIEIFCEGYTFVAEVKNKSWTKILQSAREFPAWAGGLSGKLGEQHGATIYLEEAGLQIYEKKL
ncbi:MAG: hypothetical protein HC839_05675 [Leptolyngbyaceae cyanobacterium RM2_2_21]|nr:hypothetical protein [Leptolyngbyaceae cyanobacterium RM2_2_21]